MKKYLYLFFLFIFIVGCSSADEEAIENPSALKDKIGDCTEEIKIVSAYGDDIRIRYPLGNEDDAEKIAREWCDVNGKVAVKTTVSCQGCCYSSYLCKE